MKNWVKDWVTGVFVVLDVVGIYLLFTILF